MRRLVLLVLMILFSLFLYAIEVGGHLTEDTTWEPDNNPYEVIETLYVDSGVTLTILPGTEIKVYGASLANINDYYINFLENSTGWSEAKYIRIDGRIIAVGNEQDNIIFTRLQNDLNYNWGSLCITEEAELSIFKYCTFEHMGNIGIYGSTTYEGLDFYNGKGIVNNCKFYNCTNSINSDSYQKQLEIINSEFIINDDVNPFLPNFNPGRNHIQSFLIGSNYTSDVLICNNVFEGYESYFAVGAEHLSFAFNKITDCVSSGGSHYFFANEFIDCNKSINGYNYDSLYIKNNILINSEINLDYSYIEICDNYFEDCDLDTNLNCYGVVSNNVHNNSKLDAASYLDVFNNITVNGSKGIVITDRSDINANNLIINNHYAFGGYFTGYYNNCIMLFNDYISQFGVSGNPIFRNCIIDFPIEPPIIDGGGNIVVDSLQAQSIFVDIQNGDFHLAPGSIAIDAGFDTLGYYYPFDMDYNHRIWDGDENGSAIIDIGPYEYGSSVFGGIEGTTFNPISGESVNYVLIKINNEPGEFTFSDSIGSYQYKLPAGIYEVYAERVFYDDTVEYQIEVVDGQFTQLDIPMCETVDVQDDEMIPLANDFDLSNFPNPFNPETIISFSIKVDNNVELSIFNIKGQKIATLIDEQLSKGKHSIVWSGCDQQGNQVSSGIYFYKIKADNQESVRRMLLLK